MEATGLTLRELRPENGNQNRYWTLLRPGILFAYFAERQNLSRSELPTLPDNLRTDIVEVDYRAVLYFLHMPYH